ncbi:uncharacterized protein RSE6_02842 [Rhynchosporium secalis]|uniref:Uncharacterized protein n=1 Tax=Rhynchosporium secalis TaxID=38038 RepID=A0A1E1M1A0_RHYSE|nr:uncharacterized protein RSE6_02842 [Rhynchosporium secalis]
MPTIKYPHKPATVYFTSLSPKLDQRLTQKQKFQLKR